MRSVRRCSDPSRQPVGACCMSRVWIATMSPTPKRSASAACPTASSIALMLSMSSSAVPLGVMPASACASARAISRTPICIPSTFDDAMDSVRRSRRASGTSAEPPVSLRRRIASCASDTIPVRVAGRGSLMHVERGHLGTGAGLRARGQQHRDLGRRAHARPCGVAARSCLVRPRRRGAAPPSGAGRHRLRPSDGRRADRGGPAPGARLVPVRVAHLQREENAGRVPRPRDPPASRLDNSQVRSLAMRRQTR